MAAALAKSRNAALDADRPTLRAPLRRPAAALRRLPRAAAIACAARLAAKRLRGAEYVNITLKEYAQLTPQHLAEWVNMGVGVHQLTNE
jgi:hypothetical protein